MEETMEIKKIALSLVLLSSIVALKSFSMEKEDNGKAPANDDFMAWMEKVAEGDDSVNNQDTEKEDVFLREIFNDEIPLSAQATDIYTYDADNNQYVEKANVSAATSANKVPSVNVSIAKLKPTNLLSSTKYAGIGGGRANKGHAPTKTIFDAVFDNNIKKVKAFLDAGADVNFVDKESGSHLLAMAANEGYADIVDLLVKRGADIYKEQNTELGSYTALDWALLSDHYEIAKILIDNGFDVNREGSRGLPLKLAYGESVELLLVRGANPNKLTSKKIPVWLDAIINRIDDESHTNIYHREFSDMLKLWHKYCANMRFQDKNGRTVLFYLVEKGCINLIKCLCELDLDIVNIPDKQGMLPLDYAKKYLEQYKMSYMQRLTKEENELLNKKRKVSVLSKKTKNAYARKEAKKRADNWGEKETLDLYKEVNDSLGEKNLKKIQDDLKKASILSLSARYNNEAFIEHGHDMSPGNNAEEIKTLGRTLLLQKPVGFQNQTGRSLEPYVSARAPKMLELLEHIKRS